MSSPIYIHKGFLPEGEYAIYGDVNSAYISGPLSLFGKDKYNLNIDEIATIIPIDDYTSTNVKRGIGGGLLGGVLLGPIGAVAGAMLGSRDEGGVTFKALTKDGNSFVASIGKTGWRALMMAVD